jgi:peptidoglycan/xylan/chitin deacetylase (PgdA/CDA1 family)
VDIPVRAIANQYLNWNQVRELSRNGIEIGSHTESHPILTEVSLERAEREIVDSKIRIEAEIGKKILSFAYPNGDLSDFSPDIMAILRRAGIEAAFTLLPGPTRQTTIRKNPLGIRRVFVSRRDTIPRFVAKLAGAARLISI